MLKTAKLEQDFASDSKNPLIKLFFLTVPFCQWNGLYVRYVQGADSFKCSASISYAFCQPNLGTASNRKPEVSLDFYNLYKTGCCHFNFRKLKQADINRLVPCHLQAHMTNRTQSLAYRTPSYHSNTMASSCSFQP